MVLANTMLDWEIHEVNIKNTYLNLPLKETVYMKYIGEPQNQGKKGMSVGSWKASMGISRAAEGGTKSLPKCSLMTSDSLAQA